MDHSRDRVWLEICINTLKQNLVQIRKNTSPCKVMAVLKANAYGLGVLPMTQALLNAGVDYFGVAELNEALQMRQFKVKTQILGSILPSEISAAVKADIIMPVNDIATARMIDCEAKKQNKIAECHFLLDTGMGRLGILAKDACRIISQCKENFKNCNFNGIYSHFPSAYMHDSSYSISQIDLFKNIVAQLQSGGIDFEYIHIANSDAINNLSQAIEPPFNTVRTGLNLYGLFDNIGKQSMALKPVLKLKTKLALVRKMPAGSYIGYGCTYRLPKDTLVGTIAAGYADGLPLALSNRGYVLVNDRICPVIGRISMDYTTISLENCSEAKIGDEVSCIGGNDFNAISLENWAQLKGTHSYELICSIGSRVRRKYLT